MISGRRSNRRIGPPKCNPSGGRRDKGGCNPAPPQIQRGDGFEKRCRRSRAGAPRLPGDSALIVRLKFRLPGFMRDCEECRRATWAGKPAWFSRSERAPLEPVLDAGCIRMQTGTRLGLLPHIVASLTDDIRTVMECGRCAIGDPIAIT